MEFVNGALVTLGTSWDVWKHGHRNMEIYGTEGSLVIPDPNFFGGELLRSLRDSKFEKENTEIHPFSIPNFETSIGMVANYRTVGLADMAEAIMNGRGPRCSIELALHVVEVMTAILRSSEIGKTIHMETICEQPKPLSPNEAKQMISQLE